MKININHGPEHIKQNHCLSGGRGESKFNQFSFSAFGFCDFQNCLGEKNKKKPHPDTGWMNPTITAISKGVTQPSHKYSTIFCHENGRGKISRVLVHWGPLFFMGRLSFKATFELGMSQERLFFLEA